MRKYMPILKDALILFSFSALFVVVCNYAFGLLKKSGSDPLTAAIIQSNTDTAIKLIAGDDTLIKNVDAMGRTPLMWAAYTNFLNTKEIEKADDARAPIAKMLIEKGADINAVDNDGWSALTWASWTGFVKVTSVILENNSPVNVADKKGLTPLMIASMRGNAGTVQILLEKGADKTLKSTAGKSALDLAKEYSEKYPDRKADYDKAVSLLQ